MSKTWRTTKATMPSPEMRWKAQATIPSEPRYRNSMLPPGADSGRSGARSPRRLGAGDDRVGEFARPGRPAEIVGHRAGLGDDRSDCVLDPFCRTLLADVA